MKVKKFTGFMMIAALLIASLTLIGCGGNNNNEAQNIDVSMLDGLWSSHDVTMQFEDNRFTFIANNIQFDESDESFRVLVAQYAINRLMFGGGSNVWGGFPQDLNRTEDWREFIVIDGTFSVTGNSIEFLYNDGRVAGVTEFQVWPDDLRIGNFGWELHFTRQ